MIDAKLKERAMDIIQNKLKITIREYIEHELRELVKRHEPRK
jgi:hypothetical protein